MKWINLKIKNLPGISLEVERAVETFGGKRAVTQLCLNAMIGRLEREKAEKRIISSW